LEAAGFWRRLAGMFIDGILVSIPGYVVTFTLGGGYSDIVWLPVSVAYFTYFHGRTGQTPGDATMSVRVVDVRDGTYEPIGYRRAATRWAVSVVSYLVLLIGYLWMLWDADRQTWHDKAAGSLPVKLAR
jgi:uncharacterized RDD family membrane protein YckC